MYKFASILLLLASSVAQAQDCEVCGPGRVIGNPDGFLEFAGNAGTCQELVDNVALIPPQFCPQIQSNADIQSICACRDAPRPTPVPVAASTPRPFPRPVALPVAAPTPSPVAVPVAAPTPSPVPPPLFSPPIVAPAPDLVDVLLASDDFNILVEAATQANLVETLQSPGPFTLFAPTDAAFEALSDEVLMVLMADDSILVTVLLYHVVPDRVILSGDVIANRPIATADPSRSIQFALRYKFFLVGSTILIRDSTDVFAQVVQEDLIASNGVAHAIDKVLIPGGLNL